MRTFDESALSMAGGGPAVPFKLIPVTPGDTDPSDEDAKARRTVRPLSWGRVYRTASGLSFGEWLREREKAAADRA